MSALIRTIIAFIVALFRRTTSAPELALPATTEPTTGRASNTAAEPPPPAPVAQVPALADIVTAPVAPTDADLARAGELAIAEAERYWNLDIYDPSHSDKSTRANESRANIDAMLRACGWTWQIPYNGNGQVEWCGIFAGACWRAAGLNPKWLATYFASTYRLDLWARYQAFDPAHPNPRPVSMRRRLFAELDQNSTSVPFEPRAGDILMIGDGNPAAGDHITLVVSYDPVQRTFRTLEGNGGGVGPDGNHREGVVRAVRKLGGPGYCARRLIRPGVDDGAW